MHLKIEHRDNYILVQCNEPTRLDALNKEDFYRAVLSVYHPGKAVILDCRNLDYIDSAGISALISLRKRIVENADRLILVGLNPDLVELFQISRLHRVFDIADTLDMAIQSLNRSRQGRPARQSIEIQFRTQSFGEALLIKLISPDSLIEANHKEFIKKFKDSIQSHKFILLDIDNLKNIDGMGISALIHLQSHVQKQGKHLLLIYNSETLHRLLKMYHVQDFFEQKRSVQEALAGIRRAKRSDKPPIQRTKPSPVNCGNTDYGKFIDLQFIHSSKKRMADPL